MEIEPLSTQLIERYLSSRDLRFYRSNDGDEYLVLFSTEHGKLHVTMRLSGPRQHVFVISVTPATNYPVAQRVRLMEVINDWNRDSWLPKAFVRQTSLPDQVGVVGEQSVWLPQGIHFEALAEIIDATTTCAGDLFEKIISAMSLPSASTMQRWLDRTARIEQG